MSKMSIFRTAIAALGFAAAATSACAGDAVSDAFEDAFGHDQIPNAFNDTFGHNKIPNAFNSAFGKHKKSSHPKPENKAAQDSANSRTAH